MGEKLVGFLIGAFTSPFFKLLRLLLSGDEPDPKPDEAKPQLVEGAAAVAVAGTATFPISSHLSNTNGFPYLDWNAVQQWIDMIDPEVQARAWASCERAWLEHLAVALGPTYRLMEERDAVLLSTLEPNIARATLGFMSETLQQIILILDGVAQKPEWGKDILVVFDDEDGYYRYVAHYYHEDGEFAGSGGMFINAGCGHFVTVKNDLHIIEPVIAHELTHSCVSHLPLPAWLNEGLAVNTEHRLSPPSRPMFTPRQMHEKHLMFWKDAEIQEFWSGKSFLRNDDGNMLSYDLARIMVSQLSKDWERFRDFVLAADLVDAGAAAAAEHLGIELGAFACTLLERDSSSACEPNPSVWQEAPESGAFYGYTSQNAYIPANSTYT